MIGAALGLEVRTLLRSPLRLAILLLVLGSGIFVIARGQEDVRRWREAIDAGYSLQDESLEEAREHFAAERPGPEDRPWVDLSAPRWQDWYAATRMAREPSPLAGMAFASAETGAVTVRINRFANPLLAQGTKLENPVLAAAGGFDLVTVLTLLLPLMILALGVDVGGHERASGILPLIQIQSGRDQSWIFARCIAVGTIAGLAGLALSAFAAFTGGADVADGLLLSAFVLTYVAVWTSLLAVVAVIAKHPSQASVAMGSAWIVLCVLVPAVGLERSAALAADDFAVDLTVDARDAGQALRDLEDEEVLSRVLARFPELDSSVLDEEEAGGGRAARDALRLVALEQRLGRREQLGQAQARYVSLASMVSPAVAMTHSLEQLAGRGPEAAREYRRAVINAASIRMERYILASWNAEPLGVEDFEELVASTPSRLSPRVDPSWGDLSILVFWAAALAALAGVLAPGRPKLASAPAGTRAPIEGQIQVRGSTK